MSCKVAKLALPMRRLSIMRPATAAFTALGSISSLDFPPQAWCKSVARCSGGSRSGRRTPRFLSSASFARRSADDLVFVLLRRMLRHRCYTPFLRLAVMKSSRSPSSTLCVSPFSTPVRRSLMRDWSST